MFTHLYGGQTRCSHFSQPKFGKNFWVQWKNTILPLQFTSKEKQSNLTDLQSKSYSLFYFPLAQMLIKMFYWSEFEPNIVGRYKSLFRGPCQASATSFARSFLSLILFEWMASLPEQAGRNPTDPFTTPECFKPI